MTSKDVRDMLGLPSDVLPPLPKVKKPKVAEKRSDNLNRELSSLLGERAPPVAIIDQPRYKEKPKRSVRTRPWRLTPFTNQARTDGLQLRHWSRQEMVLAPDGGAMLMDGEDKHGIEEDRYTVPQPNDSGVYPFAKYNVQVEGPSYDDAEYDAYLRSDDWSREETDYLVRLVKQYYQKWPIVADRYDFKPTPTDAASNGNTAAPVTITKERTMEDMKSRYYQVSAQMMAVHKPVSTMSTSEFDMHELMIKYDPEKEAKRKRIAEVLLARTPEQIKEEEFLLAELQRIVMSQERMDAERKELRERLDYPQASAGTSQLYRSSADLDQLWKHFQQLYRADKARNRPSTRGSGGESSPAVGQSQPLRDAGNRESTSGTGGQKKGNMATPTSEDREQSSRNLTEAQEARFGVRNHEERLTGGISFAQDKVYKIRSQGKNTTQKQKIEQALLELRIPEHLILPTPAVIEEFGKLVQKILVLLDARKSAEKVDGGIKVLNALLEPQGCRMEDEDQREHGDNGDAAEATEMKDAPGEEPDGGGEGDGTIKEEGDENQG